MTQSITIQATRSGQIVSERTCTTRGGARRSLLAMIDREVRRWKAADDVSWQVAEREAARWMADADFNEVVYSWNHPNMASFGLRFTALV